MNIKFYLFILIFKNYCLEIIFYLSYKLILVFYIYYSVYTILRICTYTHIYNVITWYMCINILVKIIEKWLS